MQTLETALGATVVGWTDHKKSTPSRGASQKFLRLSFMNQVQEARSKFIGQNSPQEHLRQNYAAWDNIPRAEWVHQFVHTLEPLAQNWYMEAALRHGIEYQTKGQNQEASPSNLTVLSPAFPGRVVGQYYAEDAGCHEAHTWILPKSTNTARIKIRPLGSIQFGGGSVLITLNACTKANIGNQAPLGQDFRQIWCLQCTVLPDLIDGVYKKMLKLGKNVFCKSVRFLSKPMTTE